MRSWWWTRRGERRILLVTENLLHGKLLHCYHGENIYKAYLGLYAAGGLVREDWCWECLGRPAREREGRCDKPHLQHPPRTDRSQAGDRGAKPSLQAREDKKPSFVLKVIGVEREGSQELIQTTSHITGECRARLSDGGLAQQACCAARGKPAESGLALYTMYSMPSPGFRRHSGTDKIAYGNCRD